MALIRSFAVRLALCGTALLATACAHDSTGPGSGSYVPPAPVDGIAVSDVQNFWVAFDAYRTSHSTADFQSLYLNRATPGLKDFIQSRSVTAASLAQEVDAFPRYFNALRSRHVALIADGSSVLATIRHNRDVFKALYPPTVSPTITLLIGRFSTGGTTSLNGMLIGTEFYGADPAVPRDELGSFQLNNVHGADSLPFVVAHEHVHIVQAAVSGGLFAKNPKTLLDWSLQEGAADFVGEKVSGGFINAFIHPWALAHEAQLWTEFKAAMNGTDISQWLYNQGNSTGRPGDLGYFMGYRIAQAYYDRTADKAAAIKAIIEIKDGASFLAASGYAPVAR